MIFGIDLNIWYIIICALGVAGALYAASIPRSPQ